MEEPSRDEVTDEIGHELKDGEYCPACGSDDIIYTGEYEEKYEVDIEINVHLLQYPQIKDKKE